MNDRPLPRRRTPRDELADETEHGELYLNRLWQAQLELSLFGLMAFAGLIGSLPAMFALAPVMSHAFILGIPLAAVLLGATFPLFVTIAVLYQRRADALDESFRELMRDE